MHLNKAAASLPARESRWSHRHPLPRASEEVAASKALGAGAGDVDGGAHRDPCALHALVGTGGVLEAAHTQHGAVGVARAQLGGLGEVALEELEDPAEALGAQLLAVGLQPQAACGLAQLFPLGARGEVVSDRGGREEDAEGRLLVHGVEHDVVAVRLLRVDVAAHLPPQVAVLGVVRPVEHEHLGQHHAVRVPAEELVLAVLEVRAVAVVLAHEGAHEARAVRGPPVEHADEALLVDEDIVIEVEHGVGVHVLAHARPAVVEAGVLRHAQAQPVRPEALRGGGGDDDGELAEDVGPLAVAHLVLPQRVDADHGAVEPAHVQVLGEGVDGAEVAAARAAPLRERGVRAVVEDVAAVDVAALDLLQAVVALVGHVAAALEAPQDDLVPALGMDEGERDAVRIEQQVVVVEVHDPALVHLAVQLLHVTVHGEARRAVAVEEGLPRLVGAVGRVGAVLLLGGATLGARLHRVVGAVLAVHEQLDVGPFEVGVAGVVVGQCEVAHPRVRLREHRGAAILEEVRPLARARQHVDLVVAEEGRLQVLVAGVALMRARRRRAQRAQQGRRRHLRPVIGRVAHPVADGAPVRGGQAGGRRLGGEVSAVGAALLAAALEVHEELVVTVMVPRLEHRLGPAVPNVDGLAGALDVAPRADPLVVAATRQHLERLWVEAEVVGEQLLLAPARGLVGAEHARRVVRVLDHTLGELDLPHLGQVHAHHARVELHGLRLPGLRALA
eukprot:scaffold59941_cov62-Phaeocystis_antarctica.AAC.1